MGQRMVEYSTHDVKGRSVIDTRGKSVGRVDDVLFDPDQWEVQSLLVDLDDEVAKDLNIKKGLFKPGQLAISRHRVESVGENILLNVDTHDIADLLRRGEARS